MRWRATLGALMALLLPLPLVLVLGSALYAHPERSPPPPGTPPTVPVLSYEERMSLVTYQRECWRPGECEPPPGLFR